jgi:hypothetical protein
MMPIALKVSQGNGKRQTRTIKTLDSDYFTKE